MSAFDDDVIITGANVSRSYLTNRQDRALLLHNVPALAAWVHAWVADMTALPGSFVLQRDGRVLPNPVPGHSGWSGESEADSAGAPSGSGSSSGAGYGLGTQPSATSAAPQGSGGHGLCHPFMGPCLPRHRARHDNDDAQAAQSAGTQAGGATGSGNGSSITAASLGGAGGPQTGGASAAAAAPGAAGATQVDPLESLEAVFDATTLPQLRMPRQLTKDEHAAFDDAFRDLLLKYSCCHHNTGSFVATSSMIPMGTHAAVSGGMSGGAGSDSTVSGSDSQAGVCGTSKSGSESACGDFAPFTVAPPPSDAVLVYPHFQMGIVGVHNAFDALRALLKTLGPASLSQTPNPSLPANPSQSLSSSQPPYAQLQPAASAGGSAAGAASSVQRPGRYRYRYTDVLHVGTGYFNLPDGITDLLLSPPSDKRQPLLSTSSFGGLMDQRQPGSASGPGHTPAGMPQALPVPAGASMPEGGDSTGSAASSATASEGDRGCGSGHCSSIHVLTASPACMDFAEGPATVSLCAAGIGIGVLIRKCHWQLDRMKM